MRSNDDTVVSSIREQDTPAAEQQIPQRLNSSAVEILFAMGQGLEGREGILERLQKIATSAAHTSSGSAFLLDSVRSI